MHHPHHSAPDTSPAERPGCGFPLLMGCGFLLVSIVVCGGFLALLHHQGQIAEPVVDAFSAKLAARDYQGAYASGSPKLRESLSEAEFVGRARALDRLLGAVESRTLKSIGVHQTPTSHKLITVHYAASFRGEEGILIVTVDDQDDLLLVRSWHVQAPSVGSVVLGAGEGHEPIPGFRAEPTPTASPLPAASPIPSPGPDSEEHHESQ